MRKQLVIGFIVLAALAVTAWICTRKPVQQHEDLAPETKPIIP